ncbi:MAG: hypothetical protein HN805_09460 [Rhodobacteraceae bacterium]|nr:hypothetical protein [Paracoccaceae bacterium]
MRFGVSAAGALAGHGRRICFKMVAALNPKFFHDLSMTFEELLPRGVGRYGWLNRQCANCAGVCAPAERD